MSEQEKLEELRGMDLPDYVPANEGGAYKLEKTIVEFRQEDDDGVGYVAELLCWHLQAEDHQAIRKEVSEFGDIQIVHEDADSLRLELRNIDRDIVAELEDIGWHW